MNYRNLILPTLIFGAIALSAVEATAATPPVLGTSPRFCNPLPMEIGKGGSATGDVSVIKGYDGKYYMFCSGGGAWVSDDLYNWEHHPVKIDRLPVAPDVGMYNGKYYLSGNGTGLYESENPLGPYKYLGDWKNTPSVKDGWNGSFDTKFFVDDDNTPYLFYVGYAVSGVYAVKLDPNDLTRFATLPVNLVTFNSEHWWERYGEMNEYSDVAWIEGPWIVKHGDTYYLEYSASGTQWKSYAAGYYTSKSVLGPYTYAGTNPLCRNTEGIVTGPGHGSVIEGPDGNFWQFYTVVLSNPPGGRLIGMDRIVVDENGD